MNGLPLSFTMVLSKSLRALSYLHLLRFFKTRKGPIIMSQFPGVSSKSSHIYIFEWLDFHCCPASWYQVGWVNENMDNLKTCEFSLHTSSYKKKTHNHSTLQSAPTNLPLCPLLHQLHSWLCLTSFSAEGGSPSERMPTLNEGPSWPKCPSTWYKRKTLSHQSEMQMLNLTTSRGNLSLPGWLCRAGPASDA